MGRLAVTMLWLMASPLAAQDHPALYAVTGVAANDVLNIRAEPDAGSAILGSLAPDATGVEVIAITEGWAVVNLADGSGYAKLDYLVREEGPEWNALERPLTCLGTEPFWSLAVDPVAGTATFSSPEDPETVLPVSGLWPALPWAPAAAVELPDGLAVLSPAQCSDGMSDRSYGIAADLFLTGPERQRLSGCCLLVLP